jgi:UDPglucose--hexose-1-phosphate uridylyltransferase
MPELRIDPVCGRRVYVAEDRAGRPTDYVPPAGPPPAEADARREACPFCAGHEAATPHESAATWDADGAWRVRVVPNKYPAVALEPSAPSACGLAPQALGDDAAFGGAKPQAAVGIHEVIIESPRHVTELTELDADQFVAVLRMYRDRLRHWAADGRLRHAVVFKNSGFAAGASLEHVHSQLVALPFVPVAVQTELAGAAAWHASSGRCVFCETVAREREQGERLVLDESGYAAVCAYAGRQPFETWIVPTRHSARFDELADAELPALASILQETLRRLSVQCARRGFPLAYNLILHASPFDDAHAASYHWHWELIPRTTHLAGLEWGAGVYINPVSPERAARELRDA